MKIIYRFLRHIFITSVLIVLVTVFTLNYVIAQTIVDTITLATSGEGANLKDVVVNPTTNRIYVSDIGKNVVYVIDGDENSVIETIVFETAPVELAINHNTNMLYVRSTSNSIEVIDGSLNKVISTIPLELGIDVIAVNSITNFIYVCRVDIILVIDGETNKVVNTIRGLEKPISQLVINTKTNRLYGAPHELILAPSTLTGGEIINIRSQIGITVIDLNSNQIIDVIPRLLGKVALNPETNLLYITRPKIIIRSVIPIFFETVLLDRRGLQVVDGGNNSVIDIIRNSGIASPGNVVINPTTNHVYVRNSDTFFRRKEILTVIDGNTNNVIRAIILEDSSELGIAVNPTTNRIYILNDLSVTVMQDDGDQSEEDSFSIECDNGFISEGLNKQYLTLEANQTLGCVLELPNREPNTIVKLLNFSSKEFGPSVTIELIDEETDINGEVRFNITALKQGIDSLGWRAKNENRDAESKNEIVNFGMSIEVE